MDGRILGVGINEDKPIASQKVDCMVDMHTTQWFPWKHPGVVAALGGFLWCSAQVVHQWQRSIISASNAR